MRSRLKLVLYSGGRDPSNKRLHRALSELAGDKKNKVFTYIPFCSDGSDTFFKRAARRYRSVGIKTFYCLPVDEPIKKSFAKSILKHSDIIYLAGGNTFYFLNHLQKSGLLNELRQFALKGGVLAGLSAGAHIMTPHIGLAGFPAWEADENEVGLKNLKALGLVKFEFYPHYIDSLQNSEALKEYSLRNHTTIYACGDGGGMLIKGEDTIFFGRVFIFDRGQKTKVW